MRVEGVTDGEVHRGDGGRQLGGEAVALEQPDPVLPVTVPPSSSAASMISAKASWARCRAASSPGG